MSQAGGGGMALGAEFSDYQYVTKAEGFLETQYKKYGAGDKLSISNQPLRGPEKRLGEPGKQHALRSSEITWP